MEQWEALLAEAAGGAGVRTDEPMRRHTTFQTGGPADYYIEPESGADLARLVRTCREHGIPCTVIGRGSNLLVSDAGIRGAVLRIGEPMAYCDVEGTRVEAGAGLSLAALAKAACTAGLTGLEFAAGIPGSLGGAIVMNAGAYGGEMKDVVTAVEVLTPEGEEIWLPAGSLEFGYRTSAVPREGWLVLAAEFSLAEGDPAEIREKMADLAGRRKSKQPLEYPSAGSTFKRPEGYFAGKLIQDAGLSGYTVGGACVSEKHCGFVINRKDATTSDVLAVCRHVTETVQERFGVTLEMEVKLLGEF